METVFIILLVIVYSIEPFLWIISMRAVNGSNKSVHMEIFSGIGYLLLSLGKQYATFQGMGNCVRGSLIIVFGFYMITMTMVLFRSENRRKLFSMGIFLLLNLWSELLSILGFILFIHCQAVQIAQFGLINLLCSMQAKILFAVLCRVVFISSNPIKEIIFENTEKLTLLTIGTVCEITLFMVFPFSEELFNKPLLFGAFLLLQSYIILLTGYIILYAARQYQKMEYLEKEVINYHKDRELRERCQQFRHDISLYQNMCFHFLEREQYTELRHYMGNIIVDLKGINEEFALDDVTVRNTLNILVAQMRREQIYFEHIIMVSDFILRSYDMSRILWNVLMNAIDAVLELKPEDRKIFLELRASDGGYHINCMNTYRQTKGKVKACYSTAKKDKSNHGKGLAIVKRIVEEYGGVMRFSMHTMLFELDCFIPEEGR